MKREIIVTKGIGKGQTELSAFDSALIDAGVANYNLIPLSSVIPPDSEIKLQKFSHKKGEFGNRLFVVMSQRRESRKGKTACAGLGWVLATDGSGRGLFVEHEGESESEIRGYINKSLSDMKKNRPDEFGDIQELVISNTCDGVSVCALVVAVYKSETW